MLLSGIIFGAFGGVAGAFAGVMDMHDPDLVITRLKSPGLWLSLVIQGISAAMIVSAYQMSGFKLNAILCINVGVAAPAILRSFIGQIPPLAPGRIG